MAMDKNLQEEIIRRKEAEEKVECNSKKYAEDVAKLKFEKKRLSEELNKRVADQKELEYNYDLVRLFLQFLFTKSDRACKQSVQFGFFLFRI